MGQEGVHLAGVGSILSYICESIQWGVTHYKGELTKLDYIGGTPHYGKPNVFQIFGSTIITYLKNLVGIKSTKGQI